MSPTLLFKLLVGFLVAAAIALAALIAVPEEYLAVLESVPAKRLVACFLVVNSVVAVMAVYYIAVPPTTARFIQSAAVAISLSFASAAAYSISPEEIDYKANPVGGAPEFHFKKGGMNGWHVGMFFVYCLFLLCFAVAYIYIHEKNLPIKT